MDAKIEVAAESKKVYISSYYQSEGWVKEDFVNALSKAGDDSEPKRVQKKLEAEKILINGVLHVSQENYDKLGNFKAFYNVSSDYVIALQCDIEVAIQEKKFALLAEKFGFQFINETDSSSTPRLAYVEEYSIDDVTLKEEEIIKGPLYIINTHGREQSIDGPYYQALVKENLQRILVDACSSASRGFPVKNGGNRSVIEIIADECIKAKKDDQLEIVGYNYRFNTIKNWVTTCAAFATYEKIEQEKDLKLITLEDREIQRAKINQQHHLMAQQAKLKSFIKATTDCPPQEALKQSLIDVSSKLLGKILYNMVQPKIAIDVSVQEKAISLIATMTADSQDTLNLISKVDRKSYKKTLDELKKRKKEYLTSLGDEKILELAKMTHELCNIVRRVISDKDFFSSIDLLDSLIENNAPKINKEQQAAASESPRLATNSDSNYTPAFFQPEKVQNSNQHISVVYAHNIH
jgi:DNA-directed RNA polymerase subunit L